MDPEGQVDPVVRTFMQLQMDRQLDYAARIEEIAKQIRELRSSGPRRMNERNPLAEILALGRWCIEWYQGKHVADKYYRTPKEFLAKPDNLDTKLKSLTETGRKLTEAHVLLGGATYTNGGGLEVTAEQLEEARREMGKVVGKKSPSIQGDGRTLRERTEDQLLQGGAHYIHTNDPRQSGWLLLADEQLGAMYGENRVRDSLFAQASAEEVRGEREMAKAPLEKKGRSSSSGEAVRNEGEAPPVMSDADKWREAARRYREEAEQDTAREQEKGRDEERAIRRAGQELNLFMSSAQGLAARELLEASGRMIVFAREIEHRCVTLWCFDKRGLSRWFSFDLPPSWNQLRPEEAVEVAFRKNKRAVPPGEFMSWLRSKLESIAEGVRTEGVEEPGEATWVDSESGVPRFGRQGASEVRRGDVSRGLSDSDSGVDFENDTGSGGKADRSDSSDVEKGDCDYRPRRSGVRNCVDCRYVSTGVLPSDGKCRPCDGSGYVGVLKGFARAVANQSQACPECKTTGGCQSCQGRGYVVL
jgi:hypothetical protein